MHVMMSVLAKVSSLSLVCLIYIPGMKKSIKKKTKNSFVHLLTNVVCDPHECVVSFLNWTHLR